MYTYIHTYIYISIYLYLFLYLYIYVCVCVCIVGFGDLCELFGDFARVLIHLDRVVVRHLFQELGCMFSGLGFGM